MSELRQLDLFAEPVSERPKEVSDAQAAAALQSLEVALRTHLVPRLAGFNDLDQDEVERLLASVGGDVDPLVNTLFLAFDRSGDRYDLDELIAEHYGVTNDRATRKQFHEAVRHVTAVRIAWEKLTGREVPR